MLDDLGKKCDLRRRAYRHGGCKIQLNTLEDPHSMLDRVKPQSVFRDYSESGWVSRKKNSGWQSRQ